jgi:outer membrane receptor protein involved in Fe transport
MGACRRLFRFSALPSLILAMLAGPARGQGVETVTVSAQHRLEDLEAVPMAVSAFTADEIVSRRINGVRDIQFATPSGNFTKNYFASSNFSIRGIGSQVISRDSEYGVAFNIDDVYYAVPPIDAAQFYDLERIEVLRGPQSTLYGRGATGGAVNLFSARPKLDGFAAGFSSSYGNYNAAEVQAMVNVPLIPGEMALRLAGDWVRHDGFTRNIFGGAAPARVDSRDLWSARALLRWQPGQDTILDLIASRAMEADSRLRAQKNLCDSDPTGTMGCLPDALRGNGGAINLNATFFNNPVSRQALGTAFAPLYQALGAPAAAARATAQGLGLTDLSQAFQAPADAVPADPRTINSDVAPHLRTRSDSVTFELRQRLEGGLNLAFVTAYADSIFLSNQSYTNQPGPDLNPAALASSLNSFQNTIAAYAAAGRVPAVYADPVSGPYGFILNPAHAGTLPTSNFTGLGIIGGAINRYTANEYVFDQSDSANRQYSAELRLASELPGPLNFQLGLYYLRAASPADYYLAANTQGYGQVLLGALAGPLRAGPLCATAKGCIYGPPYYHSQSDRVVIDSKALYGELYYQATDTLKFTAGLRGTEDQKSFHGRIAVLNGLIPTGSNDEAAALAALVAQGQADFDAGTPGAQLFTETERRFDKLTGRAVVSYTPSLSFTESTLLYASYSRGYKAGGSNPGVQAGNLMGIPATYAPEAIDAFELGAKNRLLGGALEANLTAWYYDYRDYQIASIVANTSVNSNIDARLAGLEGEFRYAASDRLQFNLGFSLSRSQVGGTREVDTRNPTGGNPDTLLVKDANLSTTNAGNCVLYYSGANFASDFAALTAASGGLFFAPPGGTGALAASGIAHAAYGSCYAASSAADPFYAVSLNNPALAGPLAASHFATANPAIGGTLTGVKRNLRGNALPNIPPAAVTLGGQYTAGLDGFALTGRVEWSWRGAMYGRIFNDGADRIPSYSLANLMLSLAPESGRWWLEAYAKNLGDTAGITGEYLSGATSGLYTGVFYTDPRTYGLAIHARL